MPDSADAPLLTRLAESIAAHSAAIVQYCTQQGGRQRSLAPSPTTPAKLLPDDAPEELRKEQRALLDAAQELQLLTTDPSEFPLQQAARNNQFQCFRWIMHFGILEVLPTTADGGDGAPFASLPYDDVAARAKVPAHQLRSIARMAMLMGLLAEPQPEHLAHSPLSAAIAANEALRTWTRFIASTSSPQVRAMVEATERWGDDRAVNHTAYHVAWDTELPLFGHVAADPDRQAAYAAYMRVMTQSEGLALGHLVGAYDWAGVAARGGIVVDLGGGLGHASAALAAAVPELRCVVQDRAEVVDAGAQQLAEPLRSRIAFQAHDFFTPTPPRPEGFPEGPHDVYFFRQIMHDWADDPAAQILRHLVPLLQAAPGRRIVLMDTVLPAPAAAESRSDEAVLRVRDLTMQQAHNAHERSRAEWTALLRRTDRHLTISRVVQPFKSVLAVLEVVYEPDEEEDEDEEARAAKKARG